MIEGDPVYINGDGETSRDFCYVENAVQANLLAANTDNPEAEGEVFNVAVDDRTTLNELFEMIRSMLAERYGHLEGFEAVYRGFREGDVRHSLADTAKSEGLMSYHPSHRIRDGLAESLDWFTENA